MKINIKFTVGRIMMYAAAFMLCAGLMSMTGGASRVIAAGASSDIFAYVPFGEGRTVNISIQTIGGKDYLFLPSSMSAKGVVFHYNTDQCEIRFSDGTVLPADKVTDISAHLSADNGDGSRTLTLTCAKNGAETSYDINVIQSSGIPSVYISSDNPAHGRTYVDESKSNKASGSMTMLTAKTGVVYDGPLAQIKSRGNTTFKADKKAYQIKLKSAADLTSTGAANSNKTWILLANAYDPTLIHNTVAYRMAASFGINAPDCVPVDLYYDGVYRGNYLLCEKVQVGGGRVAITDLEDSTDKANSGKDLSANTTAKGANRYGDIFQYVTGVTNPEDISGGYLLELDNAYYQGERSYFITSTGVPFVVKSPENCSKEEMIFISEYVEELVRASANGGTDPDSGKSVWDYADLKSFARFFVLQQAVCNADAYASSNYFYLDKGGAHMIAGPVWDFDDSYGIRPDRSSAEGFVTGAFIEPFMNLPEFRTEVKKFYNNTAGSVAANPGIDKAVSEISASQKMNRILWNGSEQLYTCLESHDADIAYMKRYAQDRAKWLKGVFATW